MLQTASSSTISAENLVRTHYRMQRGAFVSELCETVEGCLVYSAQVAAPMWNHAAWIEGGGSLARLADQAKGFLKEHQRVPVLYAILPADSAGGADGELEKHGYRPFDEESWMIFREANLSSDSPSLQIRKVQSPEEFEQFVAIFEGAYGVQGAGYRQALRAALESNSPEHRHFLGFAGEKPVCISTLTLLGEQAGIYNVGTDPSARKRGYAGSLVEGIIRQALAEGYLDLFLQVTRGSSAERLYSRLGFQTLFVRRGYRLFERPAESVPGAELITRAPLCLGHLKSETPAPLKDEQPVQYVSSRLRGLKPALEIFASRCGAGLEEVLAGAWAVLLSRYSGEERVTLALRREGRIQQIVLDVSLESTAEEWMKHVRKKIAWESNGMTHRGSGPLTDDRIETLLDLEKKGRSDGGQAELEVSWSKEAEGELVFSYQPSNFDSAVIRRLAGHYFQLLEGLARRSSQPVGELGLITREEQRVLLEQWNRASEAPSFRSLVALFEEQASRTPDAVALELADTNREAGRLTFQELNESASQLARLLTKRGVKPGSFVGINLPRSLEMITAWWAVWKAGAAAVPLDREAPKERLHWTMADAEIRWVIASEEGNHQLPEQTELICLERLREEWLNEDPDNLNRPPRPEDAAYLIYTSGSTGQPKGVLVNHGAIARHTLEMARFYGLEPGDAFLQFSPFHFDAALEQVLPALISGGRLVVRGPQIWNLREFVGQLVQRRVTVVDLPVAYWSQLAREWSRAPEAVPQNELRMVIIGGEAMPVETVRLWLQTPLKDVRLINAYGPTETIITSTIHEVSAAGVDWEARKRVPIGRPIGGRKAYVVDQFRNLLPPGIPGELWIGGELLADGYWKRPEATRDRFIPDPFSKEGGRVYRTGDLARFNQDGTIDFLGRSDDQVKIRGFRIELGEIESALNRHPEVRQCAVVAREDGSEKQLAGWVVPYRKNEALPGKLRSYLKEKLPDYMIPAALCAVEELPLLPSGKIDRRSLARRIPTVAPEVPGTFREAQTPLELRLQLILEKVLNRCPVSTDGNFFELGGDSLQALQVLVEIEHATHRSLPLETLYQFPSIERLAEHLEENAELSEATSLVPLQTKGARPPLYLIHTTPGDILGYGNLIYHLPSDQPCYGFQSVGLVEEGQAHDTIEEMAAHYVGLLREFQPEGPYYLAGWCYGGVVAVEMAHQLRAGGARVAFLGLMETVALPPLWTNYRYYAHRMACLLAMRPSGWRRYFQAKWEYRREFQQAKTRFRPKAVPIPEDEQMRKKHKRLALMERVYHANLAAMERYRSRRWPGKVTLFNAREPDPAIINDPFYGWVGLAGEIEIKAVPGNHDRMLAEPYVQELARVFHDCLRQAQED